MFLDWIVASVLGLVHFFVTQLFYKHVPDVYMDEKFHIDQTRAYCEGRYGYWNKMITTPPLIYILTSSVGFCHNERYFNSFLIPFTFLGILRLRRTVQPTHLLHDYLISLSICVLPVLFQTSCLFYTDLLSLFLVIFGMGTSSPIGAAFIFFLAVLSRQTNIIWAAFYCFCALLRDINSKRDNLIKDTIFCVLRHWPFMVLASAFVGFVVWNDGAMVLGDKTAHEPHFHASQLLYFFLFLSFSSSFTTLYYSKAVVKAVFNSRSFILLALVTIVMYYSITNYSYNHPYLLADNRHYTFYIWRRWMLRDPDCKYLLIPLYLYSLCYLCVSLKHRGCLFIFSFIICVSLTVIPAPLVEFRYFIVPYALWRLNVSKTSLLVTVLELLCHILINVVNAYLFLFKPFRWSHEPQELQRFMW